MSDTTKITGNEGEKSPEAPKTETVATTVAPVVTPTSEPKAEVKVETKTEVKEDAPRAASTGRTAEEQKELDMLKERAVTMGIAHSPNIGLDTLRKKIEDKMAGNKQEEEANASIAKNAGDETAMQIRERLKKEQLKLIRVRIYNMNPAKRDLNGEIFSVGNKFIGTVRKFVPFGEATDGGYHLPMILYNELKSRKFQQIKTKSENGQLKHETRMVPEYSFEELPPLTAEELEELKVKQEAAARLGG